LIPFRKPKDRLTVARNLFEEAKLQAQRGEIDHAIETYKSCREIDPFNDEVRFEMGNIVKKSFESMINVNLGNIFLEQGHKAASIRHFKNATLLNPRNLEAWMSLAVIYTEQDQHESAIFCGQQAISIDKNNTEARYNLACTFHQSNQLDKALEMYKSVLDLDTNHRDALFNLGTVFAQLSRYLESLEFFKKALLVDPFFVEAEEAISTISEHLASFSETFSTKKPLFQKLQKSGVFCNSHSSVR